MKKNIVSLVIKFLVVLCSFIGVGICLSSDSSFMGGATTLLYFTIQSNLWIGITCLVAGIILIVEMTKHIVIARRWMYVLKLVFTVSITLTGVVFCFVLAPTMSDSAWTLANVLTHVLVPIFAIADFFYFDYKEEFKSKDCLYAAIPPLYYLGFASIGYIAGWNFGGGNNYPYFFLNWGSKAGAFGFSSELPFLGVVYWIIIMLAFIIGVAWLYIKIAGKIQVKKSI